MPRVRVIPPEIATTIVPREDYPKWKKWKESGGDWKDCPYGLHSFRVDGYYCPKIPPVPGKNWIADLLWETATEFEKLKPCLRENATHVSCSGVCGHLALIQDVVVTGQVNWEPEMIVRAKEEWAYRVSKGY